MRSRTAHGVDRGASRRNENAAAGLPQPRTSAAAIATRVSVDVEQALEGAAGPVVTLVEAGGERGGVVARVLAG
jgi:hypothetical protein